MDPRASFHLGVWTSPYIVRVTPLPCSASPSCVCHRWIWRENHSLPHFLVFATWSKSGWFIIFISHFISPWGDPYLSATHNIVCRSWGHSRLLKLLYSKICSSSYLLSRSPSHPHPDLSYFSSIMSACVLPCFLPRWSLSNPLNCKPAPIKYFPW